MNDDVLTVRHVTKRFRHTTAVNGLSFSVRSGLVCGLLGPNGSGKTTTIRMILTIFLPDEGEISLWGRNPAEVVRERVGYLPEDRGLYPKMHVLDHLIFLAELHGVPRRLGRTRSERWLGEYGEPGWAHRAVEELSKGQQQTVQLIGALLHDPQFIILDEPFTGLDPVNVSRLRALIRRLRDEGRTVLLSTHRMEEAEQLCDDICLIARGEAILAGGLREVKAGYGRNAVTIGMEGADEFLASVGGPDGPVMACQRRADGLRVQLKRGADPQALLERALACGRVHKFELSEPSLEEIFLNAVTRR